MEKAEEDKFLHWHLSVNGFNSNQAEHYISNDKGPEKKGDKKDELGSYRPGRPTSAPEETMEQALVEVIYRYTKASTSCSAGKDLVDSKLNMKKQCAPSMEAKCVLDCTNKTTARGSTGLFHLLGHGWDTVSSFGPPSSRKTVTNWRWSNGGPPR
ncbi:hypothetical protein QYF61_002223 [Mycteria americana]|uniref:Uncharacterized protein n=1 Tax=Mycteria americana TaxID=33587 RepID=A0AAN7RXG5_MYCAM|nr:hypothetical protein QYF61_002223 [Mycteria americana]